MNEHSAGCAIRLVTSNELLSRWTELCELMAVAFTNSEFSEGFYPQRPAAFTWQEIHSERGPSLQHVVAVDREDRLCGASLCLPTVRPPSETRCDAGWFFVDTRLPNLRRLRVADAVVKLGLAALRDAGYLVVVTEMGTEAGAEFLSMRHGFVPAPTATAQNRWMTSLSSESYDPNHISRIIHDQSQTPRRVARRAIAQDEEIIDLKRVLKRVKRDEEDSIPLREGYHYGIRGQLALPHAQEPSAYIRNEDLTLRARRSLHVGEAITIDRNRARGSLQAR